MDIVEDSIEIFFFRKLTINLPYNSGIPLLRTHSKQMKESYEYVTIISMFIAAQFTTQWIYLMQQKVCVCDCYKGTLKGSQKQN